MYSIHIFVRNRVIIIVSDIIQRRNHPHKAENTRLGSLRDFLFVSYGDDFCDGLEA